MSAADDLYRMWHAFDPDMEIRVKFERPLPEYLVQIGVAMEVLYNSNKWTGKWEDYVHACTTRAPVYECTDEKTNVRTRDLLHTTELAQLAKMVELTWKDGSGRKEVRGFRGARLMSPDKKTLMIVRLNANPLFISGSGMRITEHGIVR